MTEEKVLESLKGLTKQQVIKICCDLDFHFRVTNENGKSCMITKDYNFDRINVELVDGKVVKAYWG